MHKYVWRMKISEMCKRDKSWHKFVDLWSHKMWAFLALLAFAVWGMWYIICCSETILIPGLLDGLLQVNKITYLCEEVDCWTKLSRLGVPLAPQNQSWKPVVFIPIGQRCAACVIVEPSHSCAVLCYLKEKKRWWECRDDLIHIVCKYYLMCSNQVFSGTLAFWASYSYKYLFPLFLITML